VRPVGATTRVAWAGSGEALSGSPGGVVAEFHFREGDTVRRGDILLRLDTARLDIERAKRQQTIRAGEDELATGAELLKSMARQLEADRAVSEAELDQAREEDRSSRARRELDIGQATDDLAQAEREEARQRTSIERGVGSRVDLDRAIAQAAEARTKLARVRLPVAGGRVKVLERRLAQLPEDHASRRQELGMRLAQKRGEVGAARRDLEELDRQRDRATIVAPCDGVVISSQLKVGDVLERGRPVVEIAEQRGFVFEAAVPSEEVARLQVGLPVRIKLDAYDPQRYGPATGRIAFIAPDSTVPEGQRTAVYLVRIELDGGEVGRGAYRGRVKLGMAGQAEVVTGRESLLSLLVRKIRHPISLG
jgi:multidrug resistance efflux pump